ncbi:hypothetical protein FA13DRAFT_1796368 [Coprinellus micaceus]|uniref:Conidiation protein 6 n=1 Tax=Coprinellus micaceus TaxID=71717 RepID=A0A4Y7SW64_COPMI|nr:hypothetical protein FA13DRAFT_1796368 [Coprinellus micaceus]
MSFPELSRFPTLVVQHTTTTYTNMSQEKNPANVIRGLKSAITNPNVSEEAKQRDRERLQELGQDIGAGGQAPEGPGHESLGRPEGSRGVGLGPVDDEEGSNPQRVAGGYKATLSNPRTSDEAKAHAEEKLAEFDQ